MRFVSERKHQPRTRWQRRFHVSPPFPLLFSIGYRGQPLYRALSTSIDPERDVRSAVMWRWLASGQSRFRRQMSIQPRGSKPVYALLSLLCFPFISRHSLRGLAPPTGNRSRTHVCIWGEGDGRGCVTG